MSSVFSSCEEGEHFHRQLWLYIFLTPFRNMTLHWMVVFHSTCVYFSCTLVYTIIIRCNKKSGASITLLQSWTPGEQNKNDEQHLKTERKKKEKRKGSFGRQSGETTDFPRQSESQQKKKRKSKATNKNVSERVTESRRRVHGKNWQEQTQSRFIFNLWCT